MQNFPQTQSPSPAPSPWLRLLRAPNLLTLPGDVLAGFLLAGGGNGNGGWLRLVPAIAASACLYAAGLFFNDLADAATDAAERPDRPIPSGAVAPTAVRRAATVLLLLGILLAIPARATPVAGLLALSILLYDFAAKKHPITGPAAMGLCRSLDLLLGAPRPSAPVLAAALVLGGYICAVTALARREADPASRITPALIGLLLRLLLPLQSVLGLCAFLLPSPPPALPGLPLALLPLALYLPNRALARRFPPS